MPPYHERDVAPLCTSQGYISHFCSRCGASRATDYTAALGHKYQYSYTYTPDCGVDGYDWHTCSRCGDGCKDNSKPLLRRVARMLTPPSITKFFSFGYAVTCGSGTMYGYSCGYDMNSIVTAGKQAVNEIIEQMTRRLCEKTDRFRP